MEWFRRWQSRRAEANRGRLKMRVDWGLFGFWAVVVVVILVLVGVLAWAMIHCRTWRTIEQDVVVDKEVQTTTRCSYQDENGCHGWVTDTDYILKFRNGDRWNTDHATYDRVHVGDMVTYPKDHFACD